MTPTGHSHSRRGAIQPASARSLPQNRDANSNAKCLRETEAESIIRLRDPRAARLWNGSSIAAMRRRPPHPRRVYPPCLRGGNPATPNRVVRGCGNGHRSARQRRDRDAWQRFVFEDNNAQLVIDALTGSCIFRRSRRRRQCCAILSRCWTANGGMPIWAHRLWRSASTTSCSSRRFAHTRRNTAPARAGGSGPRSLSEFETKPGLEGGPRRRDGSIDVGWRVRATLGSQA
jgi:hypothetical protein